MAEIHTAPLPTTPQRSDLQEPQTLNEKARATATRVGNNIDLINLYARQKDWYKVFEVVGAISSRFFANAGAKLFGREHQSLESLSELKREAIRDNDIGKYDAYNVAVSNEKEHAAKVAGLSADTLNTGLQIGISAFSNWWEKESLVRVYKKTLQQELGIENPTFKDLKRSENPIITNAADYYRRKAMWRMVPDFLGLIKWVPEVAKKIAGADSKLYQATSFIEKSDFSGIDLALGGKTAYFLWYFIERQTGGHWALTRIWNKTEGVKDPKNRLVNQNVHPGELVTQEEITGLYREVAQDRNLRDFTMDDPLTGRLFQQVARYLNHHYGPQLYKVKKPGIKHEELEGSHFRHADLVTLLGSEGVDINDSYATAIRIEVLARNDIAGYRAVNTKLHETHRPEPENYTTKDAFAAAFHDYLDQLDVIAKTSLGPQWPAPYITAEIRPGMLESYQLAPEKPAQERLSGPNGLASETQDSARAPLAAAINPTLSSQAQAEGNYYQQLVQHTPPVSGASARDGGSALASILSERSTVQSHAERAESQPATPRVLGN